MQSLEFDDLRIEIFAPHCSPDTSFVLDTRPEFTAATDLISSASSMPNTVPAAPAQIASPRLSAAPIIYLHVLEFGAAGVGEICELVSQRSGADFVLAAIYLNEAQWGDKLSPWAAKSPFKEVRDFAGGGAAHLEKFTDELIPRIERHVFGAGRPAWRACVGYSLAGLFSAYAAFASDKFQKIACISASFWFSGFDAFVAAHSPQRGLAHVYASLGEAEMNPKNPRGALCERRREISSQNAAVWVRKRSLSKIRAGICKMRSQEFQRRFQAS